MRRYTFLILCLLIFVFLCGCTNSVSITQSKLNFVTYENRFKEITDNKNLSLTKLDSLFDSTDKTVADNEYEIIISNSQTIYIDLSNMVVYESEKGAERFEISYQINSPSEDFDIDLMLSLINEVSGKKITKDYIEWFLSAPEEEINNHGRDGYEYDLIYKYIPLNFWEDWTISYRLQDDGFQELVFYGLTFANK